MFYGTKNILRFENSLSFDGMPETNIYQQQLKIIRFVFHRHKSQKIPISPRSSQGGTEDLSTGKTLQRPPFYGLLRSTSVMFYHSDQ